MLVFINLTGRYCNSWPCFRMYHNKQIFYEGEIQGDCIIEEELDYFDLVTNTLVIELYNKSFGEDGVWDTVVEDGVITQDKNIIVNDIQFDDVSIGTLLNTTIMFMADGSYESTYSAINFNGLYTLFFKQPVYDWMITEKFIKNQQQSDNSSFGSWDNKFSYDEAERLIKEIQCKLR